MFNIYKFENSIITEKMDDLTSTHRQIEKKNCKNQYKCYKIV